MDKRLYVLGGLIAIAIVAAVFFFQKPPCKEASDKDYQIAQNICYENLDKVETKKELCQALKQTDECALYAEEDGQAVDVFLIKKLDSCAQQLLQVQGLCKKESK